MPRFYVDCCSAFESTIEITGEDVNHIKNVLRLKPGDKITISDNAGTDYECVIQSINSDKVIAGIEDMKRNASELDTRIVLFQGMPKSDKLEFIIQKAVELGVSEIVPVMTQRTVVKLDAKKEAKRLERYNSIALAAAKQSGRGIIPVVSSFMTFSKAVEYSRSLSMNIIPYENAKGIEHSRRVIADITGKDSLGIFIGPEGGFAESEVELAVSAGASCITLGNRILRTETAGLAALSIIMFNIEK